MKFKVLCFFLKSGEENEADTGYGTLRRGYYGIWWNMVTSPHVQTAKRLMFTPSGLDN
jgi:hypothetical protein